MCSPVVAFHWGARGIAQSTAPSQSSPVDMASERVVQTAELHHPEIVHNDSTPFPSRAPMLQRLETYTDPPTSVPSPRNQNQHPQHMHCCANCGQRVARIDGTPRATVLPRI